MRNEREKHNKTPVEELQVRLNLKRFTDNV